jgi:DNA primase
LVWKLGFALDAWDDLTGKIAHRKDAAQSLIQAGLAVQRENGGCYDKFRNRLMFPIVDDDPAKYMNSPATVLFDKSHSLYGLDRSREAISKSGTVVVVEGYTDVMMAHQFGIENVVAALGTSLTTGHARILRRYAKRIVLVFDSDVAGKAAADRALEVCLDQKIDVQLAFVPEGMRPKMYWNLNGKCWKNNLGRVRICRIGPKRFAAFYRRRHRRCRPDRWIRLAGR